MTPNERERHIELLKRVQKGQVTRDELQADFIIRTFLDLMQVGSLSDEELEGKKIMFMEPMRSFFQSLQEGNENTAGIPAGVT